MNAQNSVPLHADLVECLVKQLCTRTLNDFASEARQDGESLRQAVERYEIDYAWEVLGSVRLYAATISALEARLGHSPTEVQRACAAAVLNAAAAAQACDLLMSHDNDVAEQLAEAICAAAI